MRAANRSLKASQFALCAKATGAAAASTNNAHAGGGAPVRHARHRTAHAGFSTRGYPPRHCDCSPRMPLRRLGAYRDRRYSAVPAQSCRGTTAFTWWTVLVAVCRSSRKAASEMRNTKPPALSHGRLWRKPTDWNGSTAPFTGIAESSRPARRRRAATRLLDAGREIGWNVFIPECW